ncbi:MAG: glycosyltransferase [Lachnospiraceae bacterium]|nr:glycosyltransferase [Lachnospiraceae bacterium]
MAADISVVIPAHNEEAYIERCIRSVKRSDREFAGTTEIVVVCNRCTDRTAEIAEACGAKVVYNEDRCIAKVRNAGILAASGRIIVTIDADNRMTKGTLSEISELLASGKVIGGGAPIRFERYSFPLWLNDLMVRAAGALTGLYSGIFYAERDTFILIGGFVDQKAMEDVATAKKLRKLGQERGLSYTTLKKNYLLNSTRKYDDLGDWLYFKLLIKNAGTFVRAAFGDRSGVDRLLDELFYDYNDNHVK